MATATREAYGKTLAKLIVEHDDLFVLDADLTKSTKTIDAKNARPEHHFNMGIAEGNMMAVAAGMAASNKVVYASSFAMFAAGRAFLASAAPCIILSMSQPETAIGRRPTAVRTEYLPPTSSGTTKVS